MFTYKVEITFIETILTTLTFWIIVFSLDNHDNYLAILKMNLVNALDPTLYILCIQSLCIFNRKGFTNLPTESSDYVTN